jgi:WD40 repeat protein
MVFSPNATKVAMVYQNNSVTICSDWSNSGRNLTILKHNAPIKAVVFSPDETKVVTVSEDGTAKMWSEKNGNIYCLNDSSALSSDINSASFSPDNTKLATSSSDLIRIWDANDGQVLRRYACKFFPEYLFFSPDGKMLAAAGQNFEYNNNTVVLWDEVSSHEPIKLQLPNNNRIKLLVFSPDSTKIATASDNTVSLWNASSGSELAELEKDDRVNSIAFSPSGDRLAIASGSSAYIWYIDLRDLVCEACSRLGFNLTSPEWRNQYCSKCSIKPNLISI